MRCGAGRGGAVEWCGAVRLGHDKANTLVGLFHNLRLLKRMKKPNYTEPAIGWGDDVNKSRVGKFDSSSLNSDPLVLALK